MWAVLEQAAQVRDVVRDRERQAGGPWCRVIFRGHTDRRGDSRSRMVHSWARKRGVFTASWLIRCTEGAEAAETVEGRPSAGALWLVCWWVPFG